MARVNLGFILLVTYATICMGLPKKPSQNQIVATFPWNFFDDKICTEEVEKRLIHDCKTRVTKDFKPEQRLACSLVSQPGTLQKVLMGLYPTNVGLDTYPGLLLSSSLVDIFQPCALPRMIRDGCVTYTPSTWNGEYVTSTYVTRHEYTSMIENQFSVQLDTEGGFGPFTLDVSYGKKIGNMDTFQAISQEAGFSRAWRQDIGTISFGNCVYDYIQEDFVNAWGNYTNPQKKDMHASEFITQDFDILVQKGFYFPRAFTYAIQYLTDVEIDYDSTAKGSIKIVEDSISTGFSMSFGLFSIGSTSTITNAMREEAKKQNFHLKLTSSEYTSGSCDFPRLLSDRAGNWSGIMGECADRASHDFESLQHPAYIPKGGFASVKTILEERGLNTDSRRLYAALLVNFGYCRLDHEIRAGDHVHCYFADGTLAYTSPQYKCMGNQWRMIDDVAFQENRLSVRDNAFKLLCGDCRDGN